MNTSLSEGGKPVDLPSYAELLAAYQGLIQRHSAVAGEGDLVDDRALLARAIAGPTGKNTPNDFFQDRCDPWLLACFGAEIAADVTERNHRFFEEAGELVQSFGVTVQEAHQLVNYVWGRPKGEPEQEVGGVMVTLAALCSASGMQMHACGEVELARVWTKVEKIRAKQKAKPKFSATPYAADPLVIDVEVLESVASEAGLQGLSGIGADAQAYSRRLIERFIAGGSEHLKCLAADQAFADPSDLGLTRGNVELGVS